MYSKYKNTYTSLDTLDYVRCPLTGDDVKSIPVLLVWPYTRVAGSDYDFLKSPGTKKLCNRRQSHTLIRLE